MHFMVIRRALRIIILYQIGSFIKGKEKELKNKIKMKIMKPDLNQMTVINSIEKNTFS